MLAINEPIKRMAETLIANTPSEVLNGIYLVMFLFLLLFLLLYFLCYFCVDFFENKCQTKMKLKVSVKSTEQKNCGKAHLKYASRGFGGHLPYAVDVAVSSVLFFVLFLSWLFENNLNTKMKPKISRESTKQKISGGADQKYATRGSNDTYPLMLMFLVFYFFAIVVEIIWIKKVPLHF